jgi:uncharacterized protein (TIGR03067 family)
MIPFRKFKRTQTPPMKTPRLLTLLATALLCAASPQPLPAADVTVDISSFAPRDPDAILHQIELNVALKQYEKALTEIEEDRVRREISRAEIEMEMKQSESFEKEGKAKLALLDLKARALELRLANLHEQIGRLIFDANKTAEFPEKSKLQGKWEGVEVGRETEGKCTLTVDGDTIQFQGSNKNEWYKTLFDVPVGTEPRQLRATITECPAKDFVGKMACSIYRIENGNLTLVGHAPGIPEAPKSFDGDRDSRTFIFKKQTAEK